MSASPRVTILLADEDALRREGLAAVLSVIENSEIVAGVENGEEALEQIRALRPDIAIVDLNLPQLPGIELVRRIRSEALGTKVLIIAGTSEDAAIAEVLRAGCDGCLLKKSPARHLVDAISYVRDGGRYFSPQLSQLSRHSSDQIRRDAQTALDDRDYQVMSIMADGIRPILDRLDGIDSRVRQMEIVETRASSRISTAGGDAEAIETKLPGMIEDAVTRRFHDMTGRLQTRIEETHVRTLETFVQNIQVKLVQRVSALELDLANHSGAMNDLREYSQRTEDNLSRLIAGVDRLTHDLPKQLADADSDLDEDSPPARLVKTGSSSAVKRYTRLIQGAIGAVILTGMVVWGVGRAAKSKAAPEPSTASSIVPALGKPVPENKSKLQAAQEYANRKEYAMAEDLYRQVVHSEPNNVEALQALASVLYREDKLGESAAILDKIPR